MASWSDLEAAEPDFARRVRAVFGVRKHKTLATLRADGAPRISGIETEFEDGEVWLGMMHGSVKAADVRRDPRLAVHSPTVDPPDGDPASWAGEAKLSGRGVQAPDAEADESGAIPGHRFRLEIDEVVLTRVGRTADHLVIESWTPDGGLRARTRA